MLTPNPFVHYCLPKLQYTFCYDRHCTYTEAQYSAGTNIVSFSFVQYFLPKIQCILYTEVHGKQVLILPLIPVCVTLILCTSQSFIVSHFVSHPFVYYFQGYRTGRTSHTLISAGRFHFQGILVLPDLHNTWITKYWQGSTTWLSRIWLFFFINSIFCSSFVCRKWPYKVIAYPANYAWYC